MAADLGLVPPNLAQAARDAYREFRRLQHHLRLNAAKARMSPDAVQPKIEAVRALWQAVFGDAAAQ
jgi:glutamate-ammonia-ligase adenylyltransferase